MALMEDFGIPTTMEISVGMVSGRPEWEDVPIDSIVAREARIDSGTVEEYAARGEWRDRHVELLRDGDRYIIIDGHHRVAAAAQAGKDVVMADVYER